MGKDDVVGEDASQGMGLDVENEVVEVPRSRPRSKTKTGSDAAGHHTEAHTKESQKVQRSLLETRYGLGLMGLYQIPRVMGDEGACMEEGQGLGGGKY